MALKVTIVVTPPEGIVVPNWDGLAFPTQAIINAAFLVALYRDGKEREFRDFAALRKAHGEANLTLDVTSLKYVDPVTRIQFPHTVRHRG